MIKPQVEANEESKWGRLLLATRNFETKRSFFTLETRQLEQKIFRRHLRCYSDNISCKFLETVLMSRLEESRNPDKEQWLSSVKIFNKNEHSVKTVLVASSYRL